MALHWPEISGPHFPGKIARTSAKTSLRQNIDDRCLVKKWVNKASIIVWHPNRSKHITAPSVAQRQIHYTNISIYISIRSAVVLVDSRHSAKRILQQLTDIQHRNNSETGSANSWAASQMPRKPGPVDPFRFVKLHTVFCVTSTYDFRGFPINYPI